VACILLIGILLAAIIGFFFMGMAQARRTRYLSRVAHESGMRFSREDIFDVSSRYGDFAVMQAGHSPQAHNVIYGQHEGLPVRALDFRYEVGHGTGRLTYKRCLVAAELEQPISPVFMWNDLEGEELPALRTSQSHIANWSVSGDPSLARQLGDICTQAGLDGISIEVSARRLMLIAPMIAKGQDYSLYFKLLARLAGCGAGQ
jgi:hypothetical protein